MLLPATSAAGVVENLFDKRIAISKNAPRTVRVSLDHDLVWRIESESGKRLFTAYGARVALPSLEFGWYTTGENLQSFIGGIVREAYLTDERLLGGADRHHVRVAAGTNATAQLELRRGRSPLREKDNIVVAALHLRQGRVAINDREALSAGWIDATDMVI